MANIISPHSPAYSIPLLFLVILSSSITSLNFLIPPTMAGPKSAKPKTSSSSFIRTTNDNDESSLVPSTPLHDNVEPITVLPPPLISSYNDRIRPLLDAVDKLRNLKVMKEGIQLPTIVVVGDQSSGKSSVLESLAGISLPRGQGICTRVPLIMRLQHKPDPNPDLSLEFQGEVVPTDEAHVADAINLATQKIAGSAKGISNTPITLVVKKNGAPDLTMVDLPGITRVPVHGQPDNIYEQIRDIIMEYITPEESIILNMLSATVDFTTCESIMMSQSVDRNGQRTLAVVTKADKAPEGLLEKVTNDDVSIGLGYVCVRNRIGDESYEEARVEEARLFASHPLLSKINESIVGIPVLAHKLVQIQANIISKCLPNIVKQVNNKLNTNLAELNKLPQKLSSVSEAMAVFMQIMGSTRESLKKLLIRGEYDEYPDDLSMHCTARLAEMLNRYSDQLQAKCTGKEETKVGNFLMEEVRVLEEVKGIWLPNFLPRTAFLTVLQKNVNGISHTPVEFMTKVWGYIEGVVLSVLKLHSVNYPQLQNSSKRAAANLISRMKDQSVFRVMELVEMEKLTDYTCDPEYMFVWNRLMSYQNKFMSIVEGTSMDCCVELEGFGKVDVTHLKNFKHLALQAFDMKMRIKSYWKIVLKRMADAIALHLLFCIRNLVNKELEVEIMKELMGPYGGGIERMLEESVSVATKREKLNKSIRLLKESNDVVAKIMDRIAVNE